MLLRRPLVIRLGDDDRLEVFDDGDGIEMLLLDGKDRTAALCAVVRVIARSEDDVYPEALGQVVHR